MSYDELKRLHAKYFSLGYLNVDLNTKFALISLIGHVVMKLREKKPDVTFYQVIRKLSADAVPEEYIVSLSIVCEDFAYGVKEFPTFGIEDKKMPAKIKEILLEWLPF